MSGAEKGVVYLVGAGPGDPDLITIKGKRILQSCDVVVYDNLVPTELISLLDKNIEKRYVGKKAGHHYLSQDQINVLLVELAVQGKSVAHLKGGDPFVFGRGGEQAKFLKENNIRFEVIPGITAGTGATTYAGIPCTERNNSSFVIFATAHKAENTIDVPWDLIAKVDNGTVVVYMVVRELGKITQKLIQGGMPENMPAAVIERGTFPSQRIITAPVSEIAEKAIASDIKPPSLLVIGKVINDQKLMYWFADKPLLGLRVMITSEAERAESLSRMLRKYGAEVLPYPCTEREEYFDSLAWKEIKEAAANDREKVIVFDSHAQVEFFLNQTLKMGEGIRILSDFKVVSIGKEAAEKLWQHYIKTDLELAQEDITSLKSRLSSICDLNNAAIVRVKSNLEESDTDKALSKTDAEILPLIVYEIKYCKWIDVLKNKLLEYPPQVIIMETKGDVDGFINNLSESELADLSAKADFISSSRLASEALESHGMKNIDHVNVDSFSTLLEKLKNYNNEKLN